MLPRALFTAFIAAALSNPTRAAEPPALQRLFQRPRISDVKISPGGEYGDAPRRVGAALSSIFGLRQRYWRASFSASFAASIALVRRRYSA